MSKPEWYIDSDDSSDGYPFIPITIALPDGGEQTVCEVSSTHNDETNSFYISNEDRERAALIVRAVNSFDDLVEVLAQIAESSVPDQPASSPGTETDHVKRHVADLRRIARAALSRAQGGT